MRPHHKVWVALGTPPCINGTANTLNPQATKLFCDIGYQEGVVTTLRRFRVWFKILYRVIQQLIQHCLPSKMVYLNVTYVIATRNYAFVSRPYRYCSVIIYCLVLAKGYEEHRLANPLSC